MATCEELRAQKSSLLYQIGQKSIALTQAYTDMVLAWGVYVLLDHFEGGPLSLPLSTQGLSDRMEFLADLLPNSEAALAACETLNEKYQSYVTIHDELDTLNAELSAVVHQMWTQNCGP